MSNDGRCDRHVAVLLQIRPFSSQVEADSSARRRRQPLPVARPSPRSTRRSAPQSSSIRRDPPRFKKLVDRLGLGYLAGALPYRSPGLREERPTSARGRIAGSRWPHQRTRMAQSCSWRSTANRPPKPTSRRCSSVAISFRSRSCCAGRADVQPHSRSAAVARLPALEETSVPLKDRFTKTS
jgi:hypothetical protein